jgi:cobalt/nickel transport system permease protein
MVFSKRMAGSRSCGTGWQIRAMYDRRTLMHIPDGFIDGKTAVTAAAISVVGVGLALRQVRRELPPRRVPLLGLAAAFLFAAQMVNFPVAGGTSGHLVGGVLVAALLGPSAAIVVLTAVLIVQCFLFADGGVSALGANLLNMGILGAGGGYLVYRLVASRLRGLGGQVTGVAFGGWVSSVLAAIGCAGELAWSHTVSWSAGFPMMAGVHMLIGVGEGLIGALAFAAIARTRPELVAERTPASGGVLPGGVLRYGLLVALGLAVFVAPFACPWPDGLEAVAAKLGFDAQGVPGIVPAPAPDYRLPGIHSAAGATALAGAIGTLVVFGLAFVLGRVLAGKPLKDLTKASTTDPSC